MRLKVAKKIGTLRYLHTCPLSPASENAPTEHLHIQPIPILLPCDATQAPAFAFQAVLISSNTGIILLKLFSP